MLVSECSVVLLFDIILFLRKSIPNAQESILQWVKDATSLGCVQLRVLFVLS